jgi:Fe-S-cluster containining protein
VSEATSRQQKRRQQREQTQAGRALANSGLSLKPSPVHMRDIARLMWLKLGERDNARRAGEAAQIAHDIAETSLQRRPPKRAIACRKSCVYCCHSFVGAVAPEVFRIAAALMDRHRLTSDVVRARAEPLRGLAPAARVGAQLPCPLLQNGLCAVYAERPLTCRQATSFSVDSCRDEYEGALGAGDGIEVSSAHLAHAGNAYAALLGAMQGAGYRIVAYELSEAVSVALATPDAEQRWLAGEDVLAGVQVSPGATDPDGLVRWIAAELGR